MFKFKYANDVYAKAANAVSSAESAVRYWQGKINLTISLLADIQGENGEKIADRRRWSMRADGACDSYGEVGRPAYLTSSDLLREVMAEIYRLEKRFALAKEELAEKQAELERVRLILAEEEARIFPPVVEEEEDDEDDLVF